MSDPERYQRLADAAWRWVLAQVRTDDSGPWIPVTVDVDEGQEPTPGEYPESMYNGVAGLAYPLAEIRLTRSWTAEETSLASAIAHRLRDRVEVTQDVSFFEGLSSDIGALIALEEPGADTAVRRLGDLMTADGWPERDVPSPARYRTDARLNDATLGTAGVLLAAVWADRHQVDGAGELAGRAADVLLAEAEESSAGLDWAFIPDRFALTTRPRMPNWSHGLAGIAGALAVAGTQLDRPDLVDAARRGAEHLVTLGDRSGGGFLVRIEIPPAPAEKVEPFSLGWCHGPTGTGLLFLALDRADVTEVGGVPTLSWCARGRHSVRSSGLPQRRYPGFWDNDGRCCGTAGVGDAYLDSYARTGDPADLEFAVVLGDALVERSVETGEHAYWRFVEHRRPDPLLSPGVGWMQGAAGISAHLLRLARVLRDGPDASAVARTENWWAVR